MSIPTNGQVKIVIQFGEQSENTADGNSPSPSSPMQEGTPAKKPTEGKEKNDKGAAAVGLVAIDTVKTLGMQALNASVSQIGLTTGNYYEQAQMQRSMTAATSMASLAITAMHSPVAAAVALAGMGVSSYFEMKQQTKEREIANYQAAQYARRIGYSVGRKNQ